MTSILLYDAKKQGSVKVGQRLPLYGGKLPTGLKEIPVALEKQAPKIYHKKLSVTKTCFCGKTFTAKRKDAMFCSPRCRQVASRENKQLRMM